LSDKKEISFELLNEVGQEDLEGISVYQFRQTLLLLLIGELYGLNTFKKILACVGITSRNCYKIWGKFTYKDLHAYISDYLVLQFEGCLEDLCQKSESSWSRSEITLIIDESIFKIWLQGRFEDDLFSIYFGKYFSGQTHKSEYGFRYSLSGICLQGVFYPLYFSPIPKGQKCKIQAEKTLRKMESLIRQCADKQGFCIPSIAVSVDGAYNDQDLMDCCDSLETSTNFICVPRKDHLVKIGRFTGKISEYIQQHFLVKEAEEDHPKDFYQRVKAYYNCREREVVLLFFRFNKSKKVSVIYSTNLDIKAKTMRRRWFNRTQIEQFFRVMKHTLKIQESTVDSCQAFFKKAMMFLLKAVFVLRFQNFCRRKFKEFKKLSFWQLRQKIIYMHCDLSLIFEQLERCAFCRKNTIQKAKYQYFRNIKYSPN